MSLYPHSIPTDWLTAYHDGELDLARRKKVETHLLECAKCRHELDEWNALSQALAADELAQAAWTSPAAFWRGVRAHLPERQPARPATAPRSARSVLLRWSPGIGLLLINGVVQVAAVAGAVLIFVASRLWALPDWAGWGYRLVASSSLGWLAWLVPVNWSWLGLVAWAMLLSGGLAIVYLAWLGYELRYGAPAVFGRVIAERGV